MGGGEGRFHRVAALCSEDWQNRKRTSRREVVKAYLPAIAMDCRGKSPVIIN